MSTKIGRNKPCPCGSGRKYKKCHGCVANKPNIAVINAIEKNEMTLVLNRQREQQQGLGKPIISTTHNEQRVVDVANKRYRGYWKTFHDFLMDYMKDIFGADWGNEEIQKPDKNRHPIIKMYQRTCKYQKKIIKSPGNVYSMAMPGYYAVYLWLSYNLYVIAHNTGVQQKLVNRLKNIDQFDGAYYETYVAAIFIKAGFDIKFEDEEDTSRSHCEFTATHRESGLKYSVEAKMRSRKNAISPTSGATQYELDYGVKRLLRDALAKEAKYKRIIFIDINIPSDVADNYKYNDFVSTIKSKEDALINNEIAPAAYVFLTNYPYHYNIGNSHFKWMVVAEGFRIPDFGFIETNLHDAIESRKKHFPIHDLINSIDTHTAIPSTFDGEIPEFAYGNKNDRLVVGHTYLVPNSKGEQVSAKLVDATIIKASKLAMGVYQTKHDGLIFASTPITDDELTAYTTYPDTFFGIYRSQGGTFSTPLELYDFFYAGYQKLNCQKLLSKLTGHPNYQDLKNKGKEELLQIYCELLVENHYRQA